MSGASELRWKGPESSSGNGMLIAAHALIRPRITARLPIMPTNAFACPSLATDTRLPYNNPFGLTMLDKIVVRGARQHNLKNISLEIPRHKLTVITGLSGSGKSSLAFDTIYAEGQRRYIESLSAYARQFLERMEKPDVDSVEGLSPAISIEQKTTSRSPRSTVGTVTEIYDYMRLLFASVGKPHCPHLRQADFSAEPGADCRFDSDLSAGCACHDPGSGGSRPEGGIQKAF